MVNSEINQFHTGLFSSLQLAINSISCLRTSIHENLLQWSRIILNKNWCCCYTHSNMAMMAASSGAAAQRETTPGRLILLAGSCPEKWAPQAEQKSVEHVVENGSTWTYLLECLIIKAPAIGKVLQIKSINLSSLRNPDDCFSISHRTEV